MGKNVFLLLLIHLYKMYIFSRDTRTSQEPSSTQHFNDRNGTLKRLNDLIFCNVSLSFLFHWFFFLDIKFTVCFDISLILVIFGFRRFLKAKNHKNWSKVRKKYHKKLLNSFILFKILKPNPTDRNQNPFPVFQSCSTRPSAVSVNL